MGLSAEDLKQLATADALGAWAKVALWFTRPARHVEGVKDAITALQRHGHRLPLAWRQALIALLQDKVFKIDALYAMSVAPHVDYVPALVAYHLAELDDKRAIFAEFKKDFGHAWDNELVLGALAKVGDARALPLLQALFEARRVSYWNLLLEASLRAGPAMIPALEAWRARHAADAPKWEGVREADRVIAALRRGAKAPAVKTPRKKTAAKKTAAKQTTRRRSK